MVKQDWTICEIQYLIDNYRRMSPDDMARALNRTRPSVVGMAGQIGVRRPKEPRWTADEIQFLRDNWGLMTIRALARRLKRTEFSINVKSKRLKLGPVVDKSKFTFHDVAVLLHTDHRKIRKYIDQGILKASLAKTKEKITLVSPGALERFLREHPELWDSRRAPGIMKAIRDKEFEAEKVKVQRKEGKQKRRIPFELKLRFVDFVVRVAREAGERIQDSRKDPEWLQEKRAVDQAKYLPREGFRWTEEEDAELRQMFKTGLRYKEIAERLQRSEAAIGHRLARIVVWEKGA